MFWYFQSHFFCWLKIVPLIADLLVLFSILTIFSFASYHKFLTPPLFINTFYFFNIKESVKKGQSSHLEKNQYCLIMWGYFLWGTMKPIINDIAIYFFCLLRIFDVLTLNYVKIMTYFFLQFLGILWSIQELFLWSCCEFGGSIMIGRFLWNFVYI